MYSKLQLSQTQPNSTVCRQDATQVDGAHQMQRFHPRGLVEMQQAHSGMLIYLAGAQTSWLAAQNEICTLPPCVASLSAGVRSPHPPAADIMQGCVQKQTYKPGEPQWVGAGIKCQLPAFKAALFSKHESAETWQG